MRRPRHHQTAERRRCAGPLQCDVIDDTIKLLNDDAALELFVCIIVALVAVVRCIRETHIGCILVFFDTLHEYEAITTLSPMTGQAALRGDSGCSPRKALPGPRSSAPSTSSSSCRSVSLRVYHRRSERHTQTGKTHDVCTYSFSYLRSIPQVVAAAACWRSAWNASRAHPIVHPLDTVRSIVKVLAYQCRKSSELETLWCWIDRIRTFERHEMGQ